MTHDYTRREVSFISSEELEDAVVEWITNNTNPDKTRRIWFYLEGNQMRLEYLEGEKQADLQVVEALLKTLTEIEKKSLTTE